MNKLYDHNNRTLGDHRGFTLIEVILVLAVGSLIFAMAFLAYGQASINRRDTQRRADLGKIASELENYASDNNGQYPEKFSFQQDTSTFKTFATDYISTLKDPTTSTPYSANLDNWPISDAGLLSSVPVGGLEYFPERNTRLTPTFCDGSILSSPGTRDYVIRMKLEKGVACRDSKQ